MKDLAPNITRQRLLVEGLFTGDLDAERVSDFLLTLAKHLDLRTYGDPIIHSPQGEGAEENQGFDAFVPLIDSGIALYAWTNSCFFSVVLYTCKAFDSEAAISFCQDYFGCTEIASKAF